MPPANRAQRCSPLSTKRTFKRSACIISGEVLDVGHTLLITYLINAVRIYVKGPTKANKPGDTFPLSRDEMVVQPAGLNALMRLRTALQLDHLSREHLLKHLILLIPQDGITDGLILQV